MAAALRCDPLVTQFVRPSYARSFIHPVDGKAEADVAAIESATVLWEQHDPLKFPWRDVLHENVFERTFPSVDLQLLWPFNCPNPYSTPEPPVFPFGRFPYGDRVILKAVERGLSADDILEYYLERWDEYRIDLDRLLKMEAARIAARDQKCDVKMGDYMLANFRRQRLFWAVNHPTPAPLAELLERLLSATERVQPALADADVANTLASNFGSRGPLGVVEIPIHPKVAEHLELEWYDPNACYQYWDGSSLTYAEYFRAMIDHACAVRDSGLAQHRD